MSSSLQRATQRSRDGAQISNFLLANSSGYRFNLGQRIQYRGEWRRFGLGIERGPWSFYLTLLADVYEDLSDHLERERGHPPTPEEMARALKERRLERVPPLIAIAHRRGGEPRPPRRVELLHEDGYWFMDATRAGWHWRVYQSLRLLLRTLDVLQGGQR